MSSKSINIYTVRYTDGVRQSWIADVLSTEAAAEAVAEELGARAVIDTVSVPLPDIVIDIKGGMVTNVTTTDGIDVPALVRDYDVDYIGDPDRIDTDADGADFFPYDVD